MIHFVHVQSCDLHDPFCSCTKLSPDWFIIFYVKATRILTKSCIMTYQIFWQTGPRWSDLISYGPRLICCAEWYDDFVFIDIYISDVYDITLEWRNNGRDGISNHQPHQCLLNRLFKTQIKENIKDRRHWPLCGGIHRWPVNSPHKGPVTKGSVMKYCYTTRSRLFCL